MKNLRKVAAAFVALAALGAALPAAAADSRGFQIYNSNGSIKIEEVWSAPVNTPGLPQTIWVEADMQGPIMPGTTATFDLPTGYTCYYDLKVRFSDGYEQTYASINVCRYDRVQAN